LQYTFGQPRIGNEAMATYLTEQGNNRMTHLNDIVPRLPPILLGFHHSSPEYWITSKDDVTVTTSDIDVIEGIDSLKGNAGELIESVAAHAWYIIDIDGCS
jgi:triacylglycerol lipase